MAVNGGKRPGAGRPKGTVGSNTLKAQAIRQRILDKIEEEFDPMTTALFEKAKLGDVQAFKELFDRAMGKAAQSVDVTTGGEQFPNISEIDVKTLAAKMAAEIRKKI